MCNAIARAVSRCPLSLTHTSTHASLCGVRFSRSCFCSSSSFSFPGALRTPSGPAAFSPWCTFLCRLSVLLSATVIPPSSSQRLSFLLSPHSWWSDLSHSLSRCVGLSGFNRPVFGPRQHSQFCLVLLWPVITHLSSLENLHASSLLRLLSSQFPLNFIWSCLFSFLIAWLGLSWICCPLCPAFLLVIPFYHGIVEHPQSSLLSCACFL